MTDVLLCLLVVELVGVGGLGALPWVMPRMPVAVVALAKPAGMLMAAWPLWALSELGIVPYGRVSAVLVVLLVAALGVFLIVRHRPEALRPFPWRTVIAAEAAFVLVGAAVLVLAVYSPAVWGTERPMDMMILAGIDRASSMPPADPWLSGHALNYYYFGHFSMELMLKAAGVTPSSGYGIALAATGGLTATAVFGLGACMAAVGRWGRPLLAGAITTAAVLVAGNLTGGLAALTDGRTFAAFDWWAPSRVIPNAIDEFPVFSFITGDLHAHVMAIAPTLLGLVAALSVMVHGPTRRVAGMSALVLGTLYAGNSWSYPIVLGILLLALAAWALTPEARAERRQALAFVGIVVIGSALVAAPYLPGLQATGGPKIFHDRRGLGAFLIDNLRIYGTFTPILLVAALGGMRVRPRNLVWAGVVGIALLCLAVPVRLAGVGILALLLAWALWRVARPDRGPGPRFVSLLVAGGLACLLLPELVYVSDVFEGSDLRRMNTVFRFGYHAWLLLGIPAGVLLAREIGRVRTASIARNVSVAAAVVVLALGFAYTAAGSWSSRAGFSAHPTLDGTAWLAAANPGDTAAIRWLQQNVDGQPTLLEAVGAEYNTQGLGRMATYTGIPSVLPWQAPSHEALWGHDAGTRDRDVDTIYTSPDEAAVARLLARYSVDLVVVGALERGEYGAVDTRRFDRLGKRVFDEAGTTVWRLRS